MGPQIVRFDLRQDLRHLELLKTWPVRAVAIVRGEMVWPTVVVTSVAWALGTVALVLSAAAFARADVALRLAAGGAAMILAPALVLAQYTIHNAAALIFPAWMVTGIGRPRGGAAMGQRLIMLVGTMLILVLAAAPGALIGGILWVAFFRVVGLWILIPAALIGATIVMVKVLLATAALAPAYEQLDITSVEREE